MSGGQTVLLCLVVQICVSRALSTLCCSGMPADACVLPCQALSNITWACARVGHYNEELFDAVAARVAVRWDDICNFDLGSLAWGLGKAYGELGVTGPSLEHKERESAIMRYLAEKPVREQVSCCTCSLVTPDLNVTLQPYLATHLADALCALWGHSINNDYSEMDMAWLTWLGCLLRH